MTGNGVSTKDHLEGIFKEFKERYVSDLQSRDKRFEDFKDDLDERDKILADRVKADLAAYPTAQDFNDLEKKVITEASVALTKAKATPILISIVAVIVACISIVVAIYK